MRNPSGHTEIFDIKKRKTINLTTNLSHLADYQIAFSRNSPLFMVLILNALLGNAFIYSENFAIFD